MIRHKKFLSFEKIFNEEADFIPIVVNKKIYKGNNDIKGLITNYFFTRPNEMIYACGDLENDLGYDIIILNNKFRDYFIHPGISTLNFNGRTCLYYHWKTNSGLFSTRGLVVYSDDSEAVKYAKDKYNKKLSIL